MKRQKFTNGQVLLGIILFMVVMGVVGRMDYDSQIPAADRRNQIHVAGGRP